MADVASAATMQHPYYPRSVVLPGFAAPTIPFEVVLAYFFAACAAVMLGAWVYSGAFMVLYFSARARALRQRARVLPPTKLRCAARRRRWRAPRGRHALTSRPPPSLQTPPPQNPQAATST